MNIGINTNNESGKNDIKILNNIKKSGFKNVMLSFKSKSIQKTIRAINKLKLNISYFHISNKYANDLWATGYAVEKYIKSVIDQLELCGKYNIPIAIMHATTGSPTDLALAPNKQGLKNFKRILAAAKKNDVKIAIENIDCYGIDNLHYLLDNIKDKSVGFCYDVGHHHLYNPKVDMLEKYKDRLLAIHLHDNLMDWKIGHDYTRDLHLLPFDGKIDLEKVCRKLKSISYKGIVMLEVHKTACADTQLYTNIAEMDFLNEAYKRAEKLASMIK